MKKIRLTILVLLAVSLTGCFYWVRDDYDDPYYRPYPRTYYPDYSYYRDYRPYRYGYYSRYGYYTRYPSSNEMVDEGGD